MTTPPREPSRFPVRGTIAAAGTVGALALLLSFRGGPLASADPVLAALERQATDELITEALTRTSGAEAVVEPVTHTGEAVETGWGEVQVTVTLEGSDITEVVALQMPEGDHHSSHISEYVEPILREEAMTHDTADVSVISGATYTSEAYAASLQSALDQVGLAATDTESGTEVVAEVAEGDVADAEAIGNADSTETRTVTGDAVAIRWGDVQVAVTVQGGDIVDIETLAIPLGDRRSQQINTSAETVLREEAIAEDTADISVVSGATYTSRAYAQSLQSALDQLGL